MGEVSNCTRYWILLWLHAVTQRAHLIKLALQILIPLLFTLLIAYLGSLSIFGPDEVIGPIKYAPFQIDVSSFQPKLYEKKPLTPTLAYEPNTSDEIKNIVAAASTKLKFNAPMGFANAKDMQDYLMNDTTTEKADAIGIECTMNGNTFAYKLRFAPFLRTDNSLTWMTAKLFDDAYVPGPRNPSDNDGGVPVGYLVEGFLPIQDALAQAYFEKKSSQAQSLNSIRIQMQRYPYPPFSFNSVRQSFFNIMIFMVILIGFYFPAACIVDDLVREKSLQLREFLKMTGVPILIIWLAWFTKFLIIFTAIIASIVILLTCPIFGDRTVYKNSNRCLVFTFMIICSMSYIWMAMMASNITSNVNRAIFVTFGIWLINFVPAILYMGKTLSSFLNALICLFPGSALAFGLQTIGKLENFNGLQWNNLFKSNTQLYKLPIGYLMLLTLLSGLVWMLLCFYLGEVMPGRTGVPRPWHFPCSALRSHENTSQEQTEPEHLPSKKDESAFEKNAVRENVGVAVKNLKMQFGSVMVVKGLTFDMYENQITALLGHNGAGKTTTISILTGLLRPTSGTAIINGKDLRTDLSGVRRSMSVCPQHDVLYEHMSAGNHIYFYSRLKGLSKRAAKEEVDKYLEAVYLKHKKNTLSKNLSGGMKRKLSLSCALCGGTKVVLCDEPSAGMDPAARRDMWELLRSAKAGRTILLTTHYMDEADVLGDRIAIINAGQLKCLGSPFFLKQKYGSGYILTCEINEYCQVNEVTIFLNKFIPGISPQTVLSRELVYIIPNQYSRNLKRILEALEANSQWLGIVSYGISITTLEDVFIKAGAEVTTITLPSDSTLSIFATRGLLLIFHKWYAMFYKIFICEFRKWYLLALKFLFVLALISLSFLIQSGSDLVDLPSMSVELTQYSQTSIILEVDPNLPADSWENKIAKQYKQFVQAQGAQHALKSLKGDKFSDYVLKLGETVQNEVESEYVAGATVASGQITVWLNNQPLHTAPLTLNLLHNAIARAFISENAQIRVANAPLPYSEQTRLKNAQRQVGSNEYYNLFAFGLNIFTSLFAIHVVKERIKHCQLIQYLAGVGALTYWLSFLLIHLLVYFLLVIVCIIFMACFQAKSLSTSEELSQYFVIAFVYGFLVIPFTYVIAKLFDNPVTVLMVFNILSMFVSIFVDIFPEKADRIVYSTHVIAPFALMTTFDDLAKNKNDRKTCKMLREMYPDINVCKLKKECCDQVAYYALKRPGIKLHLILMLLEGLILFLLLILWDSKFLLNCCCKVLCCCCNKPGKTNKNESAHKNEDTELEDNDVIDERQRVANMSLSAIEKKSIVLDRVTKRYCRFKAVRGISVAIAYNECFGLLGVNGAGKSTTFKMMTGDIRSTTGRIYIEGKNINTQLKAVSKGIGYCPQVDPLLDELTCRETMRVFCMLRGLKDGCEKYIESMAKEIGFHKHLDKKAGVLSGGNKRKLSIALALIGRPSIVFLDEPTAGIDPEARRNVWNVLIANRRKGSTIVLTSHSMEECEALCTQVVIMVNGRFKCVGSIQHLKNKFAKSLVLKIKLQQKPGSTTERSTQTIAEGNEGLSVEAVILKQFPGAVLKENYQSLMTFYIPLDNLKYSQVFGFLEENQRQLRIDSFTVSQTALEEIFLEFAATQKQEKPKSCC